jgi:hypothetical protein
MKILRIYAMCILLCLFSVGISPGQNVKKDTAVSKIPPNTILSGKGESDVAGYYDDWTIKILDNNKIEMLCSEKTDPTDTRSMNRQYFGLLMPSDIYDFKISINKAIYIDDCDEPVYSIAISDTVPFYIDSALFKEIRYWDAGIKFPGQKDRMIRITNSYYPFVYSGNMDFIITLTPDKGSGYYPASGKSGKKCAIMIGNITIEKDYYLNKVSDGYELISDIAPYRNMQNKKCEYCIKRTKLKICTDEHLK